MLTVYNPITGQWERLDDVSRPLPVIARDTRLIIYNPGTIVVPVTAGANPTFVDPLGTSGTNPPPTVALPDAWRIRRFVITAFRECTGDLQGIIYAVLYGRLVGDDGDPVNTAWAGPGGGGHFGFGQESTSASGGSARFTRIVVPNTLSGVLGLDQYRIVFHMTNNTGTGECRLSHIKVYAEF